VFGSVVGKLSRIERHLRQSNEEDSEEQDAGGGAEKQGSPKSGTDSEKI